MSDFNSSEGSKRSSLVKCDEKSDMNLSGGNKDEECVSPMHLPYQSRMLNITDDNCQGTPTDKPNHSSQCPSPDSVLAWPAAGSDTTPMKRRLHLSIPDSPPGIAEDIDILALRCVESPTLASVATCDMKNADFVDAQSHHDAQEATNTIPTDEFPTLTRRVSFADEWGSPLNKIRVIDPPAVKRVLLLLLSPSDRKFEFLNIEYPLDDNTTNQVILDQIPKLVANPVFRKQTFSCFARTCKNETLENNMLMGDCELAENELLLGVLEGYPVAEIGAFAVPLLLNGDIIKAVTRAKRSGKGLKTVKSGNEWRRRGKPRKSLGARKKKTNFTFDCPLDATESASLDSLPSQAQTVQPDTSVVTIKGCRSTVARNDDALNGDGATDPVRVIPQRLEESSLGNSSPTLSKKTIELEGAGTSSDSIPVSMSHSSTLENDCSLNGDDAPKRAGDSQPANLEEPYHSARCPAALHSNKRIEHNDHAITLLINSSPKTSSSMDSFIERQTNRTEVGPLETNARSVVQQLVAANWDGPKTISSTEMCQESDQTSEDDDASTSSIDLDSSESNARSVVAQLLLGNWDEEGGADDSFEFEMDTEGSLAKGYLEIDDVEMPEMNQNEGSWDYPDLVRDHLDDEKRVENTVYWIHAMSLAAVCYLTTVAMR